MIIPNGYIRIVRKTGGGLDANGYPIPVTSSLSRPIECQFNATALNLGGRNDAGEAQVRQGYTILIEETRTCLRGESIVLYDGGKNKLGEFEVTRVKPIPSVCQIKLFV